MQKTIQSVKPVDPASLRGLSSHAETHWLTFATAMRCYQSQPTQPALRAAADKHGPTWLRSALRGDAKVRKVERPKELDPNTGALAFLTRGAEAAMRPPEELPAQPSATANVSQAAFEPAKKPLTVSSHPTPAPQATFQEQTLDAANRERMERYLSMAAARVDRTRAQKW